MDEKEELLARMQELTGELPANARYILRLLSHPDMVEYTRRYFALMDVENRCQKYEPPWSCAREAEALYKNIKYGWLGGVNSIGYDDTWCEPCRRRIMEDG